MTRALLLIDHGSRLAAANDSLAELAGLVRERAGGDQVGYAHMELASPSIAEATEALARAGATHVVAVPCMLAPGKHATVDIPRLVAEAAAAHGLSFEVGPPLGVHPLLAELVLVRARGGLV